MIESCAPLKQIMKVTITLLYTDYNDKECTRYSSARFQINENKNVITVNTIAAD